MCRCSITFRCIITTRYTHVKGTHRNKWDDWQMSHYSTCCWGVFSKLAIMWSPSSIVYHCSIKTCLVLLSPSQLSECQSTHTPRSIITFLILPIYLPPRIHTHTPSLRFIPTLQYHLSPLWTHIMLCRSHFPALVSPRSHDINTKKTGCVGDVFIPWSCSASCWWKG